MNRAKTDKNCHIVGITNPGGVPYIGHLWELLVHTKDKLFLCSCRKLSFKFKRIVNKQENIEFTDLKSPAMCQVECIGLFV